MGTGTKNPITLSPGEFKANQRVQELKPSVDEAQRHISEGTLSKVGDTRLKELHDDVDKSITSRKSINSLGNDPGNRERIKNEEGILVKLKDELKGRQAARDEANRAKQNAELQKAGSLLSKDSGWAGPRTQKTQKTEELRK